MILTQEEIQKNVSAYFKDKPVKRVWLFESYARGDADDCSDVDVLVDIDKTAKAGLSYYGWHLDLTDKFAKKVDVLSYGWVNHRIWPYIQKDMKLIYEK
jgi:uncharacterized protein